MERLESLPEFMSEVIERSDIDYSFHWGKQEELNRFLTVDEDKKYHEIFLRGSTKGTFPLAWLVSGWQMKPNTVGGFTFNGVRLVFMKKTDKEWLNDERWANTFKQLQEDVPKFIKQANLLRSQFVNRDWSLREEENYAIRNKNATLEYVDAIVLDFDLNVFEENDC